MPPYNEKPCLHNFGSSHDVHCFAKCNKRKEIGGYPKQVRGLDFGGNYVEGDY